MTTTLNHEADILSRLELSLTPEGARDLLKLDFSSRDKRRMEELLDKGNCGTRTADEDQEALEFERLGHVVSMLKSIARTALKRRKSMSESLREQVRRRAERRCEYCQMAEEYDSLVFQIDHIIAQKHRGPTTLANLAWSCFACNNQKQSDISGIDPVSQTAEIVRLFNPRVDTWSEHFEWDGPELVAKSPIGRVTLYVLGMNLPHRIAFRRLLVNEGVFPPSAN